MGVHARGRTSAQGRYRRRHQNEVHADGKARAVLEYQPVTRIRRILLGHLIIAIAVGVCRGEFHEGIAAYHHARDAVRLAAEGVRILDRNPARRESGLLPAARRKEQILIARKPIGLRLHGIPVNPALRPRNRVVLRNIALIQHLVANAGGKGEILRHHGILPGNRILRQIGIVVVVSLLDDTIIDRMVGKPQSLGEERGILLLGPRQEADVQVRRGKYDSTRLGRIQARDGLLHVIDRIGILQLLAQFDHSVGQGGHIHPTPVRNGHIFALAPRQERQRQQQFPTVSHGSNLFLGCKTRKRSRFKKI